MRRLFLMLTMVVLVVSAADATETIQINQNTASATISLPPAISIDFSLTFENVSGLTAQNLGLSASLIDPTNTALLARLPQGATIPTALPVLITIEPPATGALSFNGIVAISLHTTALSWTPGTPLRLLSAPLGGKFVDITASTGAGSYRAGANKPGFSEFLVVADTRAIDTVIGEKFDALQAKLTQYSQSIPSGLRASLQANFDAARSWYATNDPRGAADSIGGFATTVQAHSGMDIPDLWRASRDVANVAGELRSAAATLSYSLLLKANSGT